MDPLPSILLVLAAVGAVAAACWPGRGLWPRWRAALALAGRRHREDALKHLAKAEANRRTPTIESVAGAIGLARAATARMLTAMEVDGLVGFSSGQLRLLPPGRELAVHVVRAHRLWESYLAEKTGFAATDWHGEAEKIEHLLTPDAAAALAAKLGHPAYDPHGDPIPESAYDLAADLGQPLTSLEPRQPARIVHLEDEPRVLFAKLVALGFRPGQTIEVVEKSDRSLRVRLPGEEVAVAPILANNIFAIPLPAGAPNAARVESTLARLGDGQGTRVVGLATACRGAERRRLLDLGFVPGTRVSVAMVSPGGDPVAYNVRGCLVALRRAQAAMIRTAN